jgi:hypothetical protein
MRTDEHCDELGETLMGIMNGAERLAFNQNSLSEQ